MDVDNDCVPNISVAPLAAAILKTTATPALSQPRMTTVQVDEGTGQDSQEGT